jgi:putative nucleotidyltransferase with HDIG domain
LFWVKVTHGSADIHIISDFMSTSTNTYTAAGQYLPIYLDSLRIDSILDFDLYIKIGGELLLYRASNLPFTERTRQNLLENNVERLYIPTTDRGRYQKYVESNIKTIIDDPKIEAETKAGIVYDATKLLVRDVLANPTLGENIRRSQAIVEATVGYVLKGKEAFHELVRVMSFDYYTFTHSVNVCTFSIALAQHVGHNDEEFLNTLGVGALLHDVGKTRISDRILNKQTKLTPLEMELIKRHPGWGVEIARETDIIPAEAYFPILQHHEREDKSGYPNGLGQDDIHIYGKIVGIADMFDAMTTQRVYQPALETYPALKSMFRLGGALDRKLLEAFTHLMGPTKIGLR